MYCIVDGKPHGLADETSFLGALNLLNQNPEERLRRLFHSARDLFVTRAPGRLDVMGGIADYSGSLVLQLPIEEATYVALQRDPSSLLKAITLHQESGRESSFEMPLADFEREGTLIEYDLARRRFQSDPPRRWAAYVAGVFLVLMRERGVRFSEGARILISSRVPEGKGVSSSAALEVAVMQAVAAAYDLSLASTEIATLCQMVENLVVGAPCGIMDQMTAACGEANRLLSLLCQPAQLQGMVEIPDEIRFWGLDSGESHAVTGADYTSVRIGAFMGRRIISELMGLEDCQDSWADCLANIHPSTFEQNFAASLPREITGEEFLSLHRRTADNVTTVDPGRSYPVRYPTAHPIYENHRVRLFGEMLRGPDCQTRLELLGELMYQSHASYSACGLGSKGTGLLADLVRKAGPEKGLFGARITGGGSGGTVAVLGRADAGTAIAQVAESYEIDTGHRPHIFAGSSPGSAAYGHLRLECT